MSRTFSIPLLVVTLAATLASQSAQAQPNSDPQRLQELQRRLDGGQQLTDAELSELLAANPSEEVDVDLVMVPVYVTNRWGKPLNDLKQSDFTLEAAGRKKSLQFFGQDSALPLRIAILLDVSGSMGQPEQRQRTLAVLRAVISTLRSGDQMQLMTFASAEVRQQFDWTGDVARVVARAEEIQPAGESAILDALGEASKLMPEPDKARPAILLLTDGLDNASSGGVEAAVDLARAVGAPIYALALGGEDRRIQDRIEESSSPLDPLREVAEQTGGRFFQVIDAEQAKLAADTLNQELRHQYWLAFKPERTAGGGFFPIKVSVDRSGARIRARSAYK